MEQINEEIFPLVEEIIPSVEEIIPLVEEINNGSNED
jgi:hypothetical protein